MVSDYLRNIVLRGTKMPNISKAEGTQVFFSLAKYQENVLVSQAEDICCNFFLTQKGSVRKVLRYNGE